jgi:hypothetical protein
MEQNSTHLDTNTQKVHMDNEMMGKGWQLLGEKKFDWRNTRVRQNKIRIRPQEAVFTSPLNTVKT